jgi:hypothetical protein
MTTQQNLGLVWANTGGVTDPGDTKYETGWIAEIPTFQNFNFVLQSLDKNILVQAEQGTFEWQNNINYVAGATVLESGQLYYCVQDHINQQPTLDGTNSYWVQGFMLGSAPRSDLQKEYGVYLKNMLPRSNATTWNSSDITIENKNCLIQLNTENGPTKNWLMGNVSGALVAVDIDTQMTADGRSIALADPNVHKLYHEGFKPTQADVAGTIPDAPLNSKMYARMDGNWVEVTSTTVGTAPPPPVKGAGQGWYNLDDGQFYIDVNDGDSSQWVPANPPVIPEVDPKLDAEYRRGRKNHIINGNFDVWQRGGSFTITTHLQRLCDRWNFDWNNTLGTVEVSQVDLGVSNTLPHFPKYVTRINQITPSVGATFIDFSTQLEDVNTLNGRKVTISGWVNGTAGRQMIVKTEQYFGSGGSPSPSEFNTSDPIVFTGSWQKFEVTFDLADTNGKTLGTDNNDTLNVILTQPLNVTADVFLSGIQIEEGDVATDFEQVDEATEFMRCSRYLRPLPIGNTAAATTATDVIHEIPLSPPMRVSPSLIAGSGTTTIFALGGFNSVAAPVLGTSSPNGVTVNQGGFSGLAANFPYAVTAQPTAQPHLLSAE